MNAETLLENFEILAEAPGGIDRLRELLLHLGVSGKLLPQISAEVREEILWSVDSLRLDEHRIWGESYLENSPATWPKIPLARLGSWGSGGTPTRGNKTYYDGEIPWLVIGDLNDGVVTTATNSITKKGLEESSAVIVPVGAVFVAMYGSIGKSGIAGFECATNQAIAHCVPDRKVISTEYLFLVIRAVKPRLFSQGRGLAQQNISQTVLKHLMISVPPLAEQKRIVAKVDELMALCDQLEQQQQQRDNLRTATRKSAIDAISTATTPEELEAAWKRINNNWEVIADTPESVDALRTAILDLSVHGQLVPHDYSDYSAQELVAKSIALAKKKSALDQHASEQVPFEIPSHWAWSTVAGMCDTQTGTTPKILNSDNDREKIQYVTAADMVKQRALENNFIPLDSARRSGRIASKDSVLFVGIGATIGKSCLIESSATFNQQIHAATPRNMSAKYLNMVLASGYFQKICRESTNATAIPILNKSKWEKIGVPIPPLSEQIRIVKKVNELFDLCDQLESELKSRSEAAEKFARSVVNAA